ncbi:gap junction beta-7 protein [Manis pentadactyla]|uniref:gap junction beta-7 protein n=1 Tax=Manis pentadactyla TaxID=143292 RepID=UPI00255C2F6C|nr:gap junction beta-7 protein [Manis pentadactyla]XP_036768060.2 gap junction beta-7 protein [Manis pentadactyla]
MSWLFLRDLLSGVNKHSTEMGRVWLAAVCILRVLVYVVTAEQVWKDEQKDFECNVRQPGCENVCFDYFFPISQVRLWALQLIVVSTPSLLVVLHAASCEGREKRPRERLSVGPGRRGRSLWYAYLVSLLVKTGFEIGFLVLFYKLYDGFSVPYLVKCDLKPCPSTVECFISKPTEKTIFTLFLVASSGLCVVLNTTELSFLVLKWLIKYWLQKYPKRLRSSAWERRKLRSTDRGELGAPALLQDHREDSAASPPWGMEQSYRVTHEG